MTTRTESMRTARAAILAPLALALVLGLAACGGDAGGDEAAAPPAAGAATSTAEATTTQADEETGVDEPSAAAAARRPAGEDGLRVAATRAQIVVQESEFGPVLFDGNGQVVYAFELDRPGETNCVSADCVKAWPPVLTEQAPTAGPGVDADLLGTVERDDGSLQVSYAGRPLYFYEHEAPNEIRCHDVNLHGGLWWVVAPGGDPVT